MRVGSPRSQPHSCSEHLPAWPAHPLAEALTTPRRSGGRDGGHGARLTTQTSKGQHQIWHLLLTQHQLSPEVPGGLGKYFSKLFECN